jgi:AraC-like DNA-binding protein
VAQVAERYRVDLAVPIAQPNRAQGEAFDGALALVAGDVFADPEGVVGQVEDARDDILHQGLAPERKGEAQNRHAGQERRDVDADILQRDQDGDNGQNAADRHKFHAIVDSVRSELAVRLLQNRRASLDAVADMLGFSSVSAFSRWFRDRFGTRPSEWRKQALQAL